MSLDLSHEPERFLFYAFDNVFRYYSRSPLGIRMRELADADGTFVDVGANLGSYALVAGSLDMATVVVEPEPRHAAFLERNAKLFGRVLQFAVSDEDGHLPLYYQARNPGATSLFPHPEYLESKDSVTVVTFGDLFSQGRLGKPSKIRMIKIDVEGFEGEAVRGMYKFLDAGHRPEIWCEVRGELSERNGGSCHVVTEILRDFGYEPHEYVDGKPVAVDSSAFAGRSVFDLLFIPQTL
jgi:FkbM family methyltransferase